MKIIALTMLLLAVFLPAEGADSTAVLQDSKQPPARKFTPFDFLQSKHLPFTGGFCYDEKGNKDPELEFDFMPVDGSLWMVQQIQGFYYTVTNQTDLDAVLTLEKRKLQREIQLFAYSGLIKWKVGERPPAKKVAGHYVNVIAKRENGWWYVLDNRPITGNICGTRTVVTNDYQLLEIGMDAVRRGVEEMNGKLPIGPPPGEEDPPKHQKDPPFGV